MNIDINKPVSEIAHNMATDKAGANVIAPLKERPLVRTKVNSVIEGDENKLPLKFLHPDHAIKITDKQAKLIFGRVPDFPELRGDLRTFGPWQIPLSYRALCVTSLFDSSYGYCKTVHTIVFGFRTMVDIKQSGYQIEGRVSYQGKKIRCFSSTQMFELENGQLVNVAVIFACTPDR